MHYESVQYNKFKKQFDDLKRTNSQINKAIWAGQNQVRGVPSGSQELNMVFFRSAIVNILAAWEAYVQDLFQETKDIVVDSIKAGNTTGMRLVESAIRTKSSQKEKLTKKLVERYMKLIENPNVWKTHLDEYMKLKLDNAIRVVPVFSGDKGIDKKFRSLFEIKDGRVCLSKLIMTRRLCHSFYVRGNEQEQLTLTTADDLDILIRLYYGARCVFAHGQSGHTFGKRGALEKFPSTSDALVENVGHRDVADRLIELYDSLKKDGMQAQIYYVVVMNIQRFIFYLGQRLIHAIAKCIYDEFKLRIWMYDPYNLDKEDGRKVDHEMDDFTPDLPSLFHED